MGGESTRLRRIAAVSGFAVRRAVARIRTAPRQTAAIVGIVALTIALLVMVTGIGVALADGSEAATDADLRVAPADGSTLSAVVDVEGPRLSDVHDRSAEISRHDDVSYASPVLAEPVEMRTTDGDDPVTVLALGVVNDEPAPTVAGVSTANLEPGDPHYADGEETGEIVLSRTAADQLEADADDHLIVRSPSTGSVSQSHDVTAIESAETGDAPGEFPIVVMQLSELQALTGADDDDLADQVLVGTETDGDDDVTAALEETFPEASVEATGAGESDVASLSENDLALATSLVAFVVGLSVCALVVATATGLSIERERKTLAVLAAVGFSTRARLSVVALSTLTFVLAGGVLGLLGGVVGIAVVNAVATATVAPGPIATVELLFVPYGLAVALVAGLLAMPYPLVLAARTNVIEELTH